MRDFSTRRAMYWTRREVMTRAVALAAWSASGRATSTKAGIGISRRPNIIFVLADDLGYADLSCYGRRDYETPHLDRLARDGVMLSQGYANSPVCSATRISLMTGRYQYRLKAGLQEPIDRRQDVGLPPAHPTLPSLLQKGGYRTSLIGKWHMGELPRFGPLMSGYDEFFGIYGGSVDYFEHAEQLYDGARLARVQGYLTDVLMERAVDRIAGAARLQQPFFLSLHLTAPHWPWEAPDDGDPSGRPRSQIHLDGGNIEIYGKMVRNIDENISKLLSAIETAGIEENTIIVFTSDNGGERFSDTWPFVGVKGELLEGGLRVPLIMRWPGGLPGGTRSTQVMTTMDFLPTLLAAAGLGPDSAYPSDGINLLPMLNGSRPEVARELYWRFKTQDQAAARRGDWKYLKIARKEYLFDLAYDQREQANLKDLRPEVFAQLKAAYANWNATMLPYGEFDQSVSVKNFLTQRY